MESSPESAGDVNNRRKITNEEIARYRKKLLDLSGRNHLISFHHSDRSRKQIRAIDDYLNNIYTDLDSGKNIEFEPLEPPDVEPEDEKTAVFRKSLSKAKREDDEYIRKVAELGRRPSEKSVYRLEQELRDRIRVVLEMPPISRAERPSPEDRAKELNINPKFELQRGQRAKEKEGKRGPQLLQTLLYPDDLEIRLRGIYEASRLSQTETGINTLYLAIGFLEWYDAKTSEESILSPLMLYPIEIEKHLHENQFRYLIHSRDEDVLTNLPLRARLKNDFDLVVPDFVVGETETGGDTPDEYMARIEKLIQDHKDWRVHRYATVSFFSFAKIAMYMDLDPEMWKSGGLIKGLLDIFAGLPEDSDRNPEDYDIDDPEFSRQIPLHITDADSSQLSALIDVAEGKNLIIEGPPGTGKSQTITNIIASALSAGKSVLFVAEKLAALQVVKKRLDGAGLGYFCLELHSNKTRKTEVLKSLRDRLDTPQRLKPQKLEMAIRERKDLKDRLNEYVHSLQAPIGSMGLTVHDVLGKSASRQADAGELLHRISEIAIKDATELTPSRCEDIRSALRSWTELATAIVEKYPRLDKHPWYGFVGLGYGIVEQENLKRRLSRLQASVKELHDKTNKFLGEDAQEMDMSCEQLRELCRILTDIPLPSSKVREDLLTRLHDASSRLLFKTILDEMVTYIGLRKELANSVNITKAITYEAVTAIGKASETYKLYGLSNQRLEDLPNRMRQISRELTEIGQASKSAIQYMSILGVKSDLNIGNVYCYFQAGLLAFRYPKAAYTFHHDGVMNPDAYDKYCKYESRLKTVRQKRAKGMTYTRSLDNLNRPALVLLRDALKKTGMFSAFTLEHWRNSRQKKAILNLKPKLSKTEAVSALDEIIDALKSTEEYNEDVDVKVAMGPNYKGIETDFGPSKAMASWAQQVRRTLNDSSPLSVKIRDVMLTTTPEMSESICRVGPEAACISAVQIMGRYVDQPGLSISMTIADVERQLAAISSTEKELTDLGVPRNFKLNELEPLRDKMRTYVDLLRSLGGNQRIIKFEIDDIPQLLESGVYSDTLIFSNIISDAKIPHIIQKLLFGPENQRQLARIKQYVDDVSADLAVALSECAVMGENRRGMRQSNSPVEIANISASILIEQIAKALALPEELGPLAEFVDSDNDLVLLDLGSLIKALTTEPAVWDHALLAYEFCLFRTLAEIALNSHPVLQKISGVKYEELRKRFIEIDRELLKLLQKSLVAQLCDRSVPRGTSVGRASERTELGLIEHEIGKKRRHIAVRELLNRAGDLPPEN